MAGTQKGAQKRQKKLDRSAKISLKNDEGEASTDSEL
jgi:hypothetical protein